MALRPRTVAMLCYLAEHANRLVGKTELRQHVWAGTHVTDTVLWVCVQEIRAALGDAGVAPFSTLVTSAGRRWRGHSAGWPGTGGASTCRGTRAGTPL